MKYELKILLIHLISCLVLILLSLVGLFFRDWEIFLCITIASIFSLIYSFLLIKGSSFIKPNNDDTKAGLFMLFTFLRFLVVILGLLIPAIIIYFVDGVDNKLKFLNLIGATIPFALINVILIIKKDS